MIVAEADAAAGVRNGPGAIGHARDMSGSDDAPRGTPQSWDPLLYAGSARHYRLGRVAYPPELGSVIADGAGLAGTSTAVDVGCGPGALTLLLARHSGRVIGVDPDPGMLAEAERSADAVGATNVTWLRMPAEDLPADICGVTAVTFAQSFHWMDRPRVAAAARQMLAPGGALAQVHATTHRGVDTDEPLGHPQPPWTDIDALVRRYLGPERRAGGRVFADGFPGGEDVVFREAGFRGPTRVELPARRLDRTTEEIVHTVYSLSSSAPHLFGDRLPDFDSDLNRLVDADADQGKFTEMMRAIAVDFWH